MMSFMLYRYFSRHVRCQILKYVARLERTSTIFKVERFLVCLQSIQTAIQNE